MVAKTLARCFYFVQMWIIFVPSVVLEVSCVEWGLEDKREYIVRWSGDRRKWNIWAFLQLRMSLTITSEWRMTKITWWPIEPFLLVVVFVVIFRNSHCLDLYSLETFHLALCVMYQVHHVMAIDQNLWQLEELWSIGLTNWHHVPNSDISLRKVIKSYWDHSHAVLLYVSCLDESAR